MTPLEGATFRELVRRHAGIVLEQDKDYFVASRVGALAEREATSVEALARAVRDDPRGPLARRAAEAMLVAETSFFRDPGVFETLRTRVLPDLLEARAASRSLRIWSAACATGQEPYSLAMLLREHGPRLAGWSVELLATDVSEEALAAAARGVFGHLEVNRGLPARLLLDHFERRGFDWHVAADLRRMVEFRRLNLVEPWPALPEMDLILLRNVLIYFDTETKRDVLRKVRSVLRPGGLLVLGSAETTVYLDEEFEPEQVGVYRRRRAATLNLQSPPDRGVVT